MCKTNFSDRLENLGKVHRFTSHLGMFVTTGCSSGRQSVPTANRQDTSSRQQNTDSGRQVTASGQFYKPNQTQEPKYGNYALLLLCRLKWKKCIYLQRAKLHVIFAIYLCSILH